MVDLKPFRQVMDCFCFINRFRIMKIYYMFQCLSSLSISFGRVNNALPVFDPSLTKRNSNLFTFYGTTFLIKTIFEFLTFSY